MNISDFNSNLAPESLGAYPHSKKLNNLLFLSGIGPRKRNSSTIPGVTLDKEGNIISYDIEEQCYSVFNNVRNVLEASGSRLENLLDVTVFLTDIKKDFPVYNRIYNEYFQEAYPCRTTIGVNGLPTPIAIELKCIAFV